MEEEKKIIRFTIGYLIVGIIICLIGISNVFAATYYLNYEYRQQYYNNHGSYVETINTTWNESLQSYISGNIPTTANSYGAGLSISSPIPIITNHTYTISFYFEDISNIALSSKNNIAIGMTLSAASGNYASNNFWAETIQSTVKNNSIIQYVFKANGGADYIFIPWTTTTSTSQSYVVTQIIMEDLGSEGLSQEQINTSLNNQTNELNNSIQNSTNIVIGEINEIEQSIVESNKETQEVIKDQFNDCRDSYNLFDINRAYSYGSETNSSVTGNSLTINGKWFAYQIYNLKQNTDYYLSFEKEIIQSATGIGLVRIFSGSNTNNIIQQIESTSFKFNTGNNTSIGILFFSSTNGVDVGIIKLSNIMLNEGSSPKPYEPYGEEICTNKLDEAEETRKGIWATIKELPDIIMEKLKGLFIPEDGYFEEWFNDLKLYFEDKLGFLVTPFSIIIDFINRYLALNPKEDIIINIPDINVPNFEDNIIIEETSLNWSELLKSKESLNMLWELYLAFIDVFLILNFINLCENKYNRIFGGDTTQYEYYTVEESYTINDNTGEATNHRLNERKTTRKRVN